MNMKSFTEKTVRYATIKAEVSERERNKNYGYQWYSGWSG